MKLNIQTHHLIRQQELRICLYETICNHQNQWNYNFTKYPL